MLKQLKPRTIPFVSAGEVFARARCGIAILSCDHSRECSCCDSAHGRKAVERHELQNSGACRACLDALSSLEQLGLAPE